MGSVFGVVAKTFKEKALNVIMGIGLTISSILVVNLFLSSLGISRLIQFHEFTPINPVNIWFGLIWAPLWEEAAFRYFPIKVAETINPKLVWPVILISSIIFGWGHGAGPISLMIQGVGGLILSYVYVKNGNSYISSVIVHMLWNFIIYGFVG